MRTYVGNGLPNPVAPLQANLWPYAMCVAPDGTLYFSSHSVVRRLIPGGLVETIAGQYPHNWQPGEGGPAIGADFRGARDILLDLDGSLVVVDIYWSVVRRIANDGTLYTMAGQWGVWGFGGDGGPATEALLANPVYLEWGPDRSLYVSDYLRVRRIAPDGTIWTFAGNGTQSPEADGEGGPATDAAVPGSGGMAVDGAGNVFIAVDGQARVRRVGTDGVITTIAGKTYGWGWTGDGGPAVDAEVGRPSDVVFDPAGNLLIADPHNGVIRMIDQTGTIHTIAGTGTVGYSGDGGPATVAMLGSILDLEFDPDGNLYVLDDTANRIRVIDQLGIIRTIAGNGTRDFGGDGGPADQAAFTSPHDPTFAADGSVFIADVGNYRIRHVSPLGVVSTYAGTGLLGSSGDGGPASDACLETEDITLAPDGTLYFIDGAAGWARVRKITPAGIVEHVSGRSGEGYAGDGEPAATALFKRPTDIHYGRTHQRLYIADTENDRVRYVDQTGYIWTLIGNGTRSSTGDGGLASLATVSRPGCVYEAARGDVYISELSGNRVRKIDLNGFVTTVAGGVGEGFSGDGGPAVLAKLDVPVGLCLDRWGYLYIADAANNRIRRVSPDGIITTVAGTGMTLYDGEDVPALSANLWKPLEIAGGPGDVLYIDSQFSGRISMLIPELRVPTAFGTLQAATSREGLTLSWETWFEDQVSYVIERSDDVAAPNFRLVAVVDGNGPGEMERLIPWGLSDAPGTRVAYRVRVLVPGGVELAVLGPVAVLVDGVPLHGGVSVSAHPNPFNPRVTIVVTLPRGGEFELTIYDQAGRRVVRVAAGELAAGPHRFEWDGRDAHGAQLASGVYRIKLRGDGRTVAQVAVTLVR